MFSVAREKVEAKRNWILVLFFVCGGNLQDLFHLKVTEMKYVDTGQSDKWLGF
jgi:hypothetical protein